MEADRLCTPWGRDLPRIPLPEHPDPMMERARWESLNGWWQCAIVPAGSPGPAPGQWRPILVPFAVETPASGVARPLLPDERLHYRRPVPIPPAWRGERIRIHFSAVDHECEVLIDGRPVARHTGGYLPFHVDVADTDRDAVELRLRVADPTDTRGIQRGKQSLNPRTIWYTATSGIWGSVWMEALPRAAIEAVDIRTEPDLSGFRLRVDVEGAGRGPFEAEIGLPDGGRLRAAGTTGAWRRVEIPDPLPWSPDSPALYRFTIRAGEDEVRTWSALRTVGLSAPPASAGGAPRRGLPDPPGRRGRWRPRGLPGRWAPSGRRRGGPGRCVLLNGEPVLVNAPLSQGYWPESGMTPPCEAALLHDLVTLRRMGFNAVRVHVKVESRRFYHLCDRLGLMVVQDMVSGGVAPLGIRASGAVQALGFTLPDRSAAFRRWTGRSRAADRVCFVRELAGMIRHLRSHPCIVMWVPFNEAWGQFDARRAERFVRRADPSRLVDAASGWFDQGGGDFRSRHRYVLRLVAPPRGDGRAFYLSEFGGLNLAVEGRAWPEAPFGYRFLEDRGALARAMTELYRGQLVPLVGAGLAACTYTQVSDVERESNGLMTYDRVVVKVDPALMARLNRELEEAFVRVRRA
ncbi:hypothetical protein AM609_06255 [Actinomyces sp. oral taxon 414]|uniref:glycoside hydrolase family 2 protein n=1 Tax=Actinomyces sp. oral taxon 414 TaxID=712122 RepID=UPI0006AE793C|nr:glycoside hydrolase family 2 TIM barrel-domain containing protein [Actinomyces sp. oral taxon 414]ALC99184.1 hypothetical protein AM609_06255 [Actinomyces sp. oral taxon 414]